MRGGFIWDDNVFLYDNPLIHAPDGLYRFWFTTQAPDYFPLVSSSLWFEWRLWGMHPVGYHIVNILLHAGGAVMLWRLLLALEIPGAWMAALIYAIHPVNVETVAWITERKNTLPMVFLLPAMLLFLKSDRSGSRRDYVLALVAFLLALLAKTSVVMLPFVLLICAWWMNRRVTRRHLLRVVPFFGLSALAGLVTVWFQYNRAIRDGVVRTDGFASRLAIAGRAIWFYLAKAIWPFNLSFVYPRWVVDPAAVRSYLPVIVLAVTCCMLWFLRRRSWAAPIAVAMGCYLVNLLPVLGFTNIYFMRYSLVADHWQYTAMPAVIALVVGSLAMLARRGTQSRNLMAFGGVVAIVVLSISTYRRCEIYHDLETLWRDTLAKNPLGSMPNNNYATLLLDDGKLDEAEVHLRTALQDDPRSYEAVMNLGLVFERRGDKAGALEQFRRSAAMEPRYSFAQANLGRLLIVMGQSAEGVEHLNAAIASNPRCVPAYRERATAREAAGDLGGALADLQSVAETDPSDADLRVNLSRFYVRRNDPQSALREGRAALEIDPENAAAHNNWGMLLEAGGDGNGAVREYRRALQLQPDFPQAERNLRRVSGQPAAPGPS